MTDSQSLSMTRRGTLALAGAALAATAARGKAAAGDGWAAVDAMVAALVADHAIPGLSLAVMKGGSLVRAKGYGLANIETGTPVTPDTVFRIGSITKQFTGAALALLQQDGKLSVDDKLAKYLPEVPRGGEISLRQMLNHVSGLGNYTDRKPPEAFLQSARLDYDDKALLADMLAHTDPLFAHPPGTEWDYSNTAYVLLGLVVARVAGEAWPAFFQRRLFAPAGMMSTAVDDQKDVVPHRAAGYSGRAGSDTQWDNAAYIAMTYPGAAGNIRSTATDLCRWHAALLGGKVVGPAALQAMMTPARLNDGSVPTAVREAGAPKTPVNYGFGLFMGSFNGHASVGHGGGIFGFVSDLRSFPKEKISVAILINTDGFGRKTLGKSFKAIQDAVAIAALA
ncbi:serine hydrolase domain-containing protein [Sandarakinorhabdus limnophila]|uniref:serine hydrolase domain-containing protein n=1 Tax=Sandarakinorhabdus limnophila TaxID=210512 RepID=UPI0026F15EDF|nr:serine hydrolase domain-containing protein [Sandarakinorhabdus limnophila]